MNRYVVIDLETTGNAPGKEDRIIEVGIVVIENDSIVDSYSTLLNPKKEIPLFITNLTGISDSDVAYAPSFEDNADEIIQLFTDSYLIAHNVPFDLGFLNVELENCGKPKLINPVLDTVELSRILFPTSPSFKLSQLTEYLEINHNEPHRALSDAFVTAKLFLKLKEKMESLPYETIVQLLHLEKTLKSDVYELLHNCQEKLMFQTEEDPNMDSYHGIAYRRSKQDKESPMTPDCSFGELLDEIYEDNGTMEQKIVNYEKRPGQRVMSETVFDAFQGHQHAFIEAETGTGKSLAYLIPTIYEAITENKRIVISTFTTQLQTQLLEDEIPMIRQLVRFPFKATLLKGKSHYISLERLEQELSHTQHDNYDITLTKAMIVVWLTDTVTGDIDEIQLPSSGYMFFSRISADMEDNIDPSSPWFSRSYYQKARRRAQQANIVITNHALLCTDMFNDYQLLPSYHKAIIDEAHHLEDTASRHYGLKLDYVHLQYMLNQLGKVEDNKLISKILSHYNGAREQLPLENWDIVLEEAKHETDDLFRHLFQYVLDQHKSDKSLSDIGRTQYRFEDSKEIPDKWNVIKEMVTRLTFYLRDLIHGLALIEFHLVKQFDFQTEDKEEIQVHTEHLQECIDRLEQLFLIAQTDKQIKWIEIETYGAKNAVYLYSEPTDVARVLADHFFQVKDSIILTSATLTMKQSFDFIQARLGVSSERLITQKIASPFSYQDQVQLMVPNDFPDIKYGKMDDFIYATCEAILSLAEITKGRMLVLFTSYDMLKKSHTILKESLDIGKYALIAQGISSGSRTRLKKNFQTFDQAILLGTSSFWEGVDIPGEALSCLMIVRLPFQPPDHPVHEAKSTYLKDQGKNAFMEFSLPNAVIRFKQGFGRLIRSTSDRGIVFVCDTRIIKARYGKYFIESIPNVPLSYETTPLLMEKAKKWF
ncbi:ATP-dependent DNA helicase DinG [Virgibacillus salexigens]|uniref:ATP-dependent DNA helicase DinG n=1 Tax=Virgibacillus TaxID=84406 RepID=UPI00136C3336|nr:ATP-dependent DNA helicase DinG [Virgibacillus massiliensis]MYL42000.1 ATP-dependent DNA helicase DinG [Virgibacillus massiliensis]